MGQSKPSTSSSPGAQFDLVREHAASTLSCETWSRIEPTVRRFERFVAARGIDRLSGVDSACAAAFIGSRLLSGRRPDPATEHDRRSTVRIFFRLARALGLSDTDPTLDLELAPRVDRPARPLTDAEIERCRRAAPWSLQHGRLAAAFALAEATAQGSEVADVRPADVDLTERVVELKGNRRLRPRAGNLTEWGATAIERRLAVIGESAQSLLIDGSSSRSAAQVATCRAISTTLTRAGLVGLDGVRPGSVAAWAGARHFAATADLTSTAELLGVHSLDVAARMIGLDWKTP